jgi:hypothetical protein
VCVLLCVGVRVCGCGWVCVCGGGGGGGDCTHKNVVIPGSNQQNVGWQLKGNNPNNHNWTEGQSITDRVTSLESSTCSYQLI